MKQLKPGERVLVLGASSEPYLCVKKDERALLGFFQKHIALPLPDYASRKLLWQGLVRRHGAAAAYKFDWPTLSQISEGYTSGQIDLVRSHSTVESTVSLILSIYDTKYSCFHFAEACGH